MSWSEKRIEAKIERALVEGVKSLGGVAIKIAPVSFVGLPDRLILLSGGVAAFVELKSPGQTPTPRQNWWMRRLTALGFASGWIDSLAGVDDLLRDLRARQARFQA